MINTIIEKLKSAGNAVVDKLGISGITKIALMLVLFIFLALVYHSSNAKDVPMEDIEKALISQTNIESLQKCTNRQLLQFMDLDHSDYDGYLYYKSKKSLGVAEVLIVKVYDKEDLTAVQDAVEARIASQIRTFEGYGPNQVSMLKNAVIYKQGRYLFYSTASHPDTYEGVFRHVI